GDFAGPATRHVEGGGLRHMDDAEGHAEACGLVRRPAERSVGVRRAVDSDEDRRALHGHQRLPAAGTGGLMPPLGGRTPRAAQPPLASEVGRMNAVAMPMPVPEPEDERT